MIIGPFIKVKCDSCGYVIEYLIEFLYKHDFRKKLILNGWNIIKDDYFCPKCIDSWSN